MCVGGLDDRNSSSGTIPHRFPCDQIPIISLLTVRCKESESPHAVTVYMLEPQTCQYILGVSLPVAAEIKHVLSGSAQDLRRGI